MLQSGKLYRKDRFSNVILIGFSLLFLWACNSQKHLQPGQEILKKTSIEIDDKSTIPSRELQAFLKQRPNKRILGFYPFHLQMYFMFENGKERKWKQKLQEVMGEEPVIYDAGLAERTARNLKVHLQNKGFYQAEVVETFEDGEQVFSIKAGAVYTIRTLRWEIQDSLLAKTYPDALVGQSLLQEGKPFDLDLLDNERARVNKFLRDRGYFEFSRDYVEYLADTTQAEEQVDVVVRIRSFPLNPMKVHPVYRVKHVYLYLDMPGITADNSNQTDTIQLAGRYLIFTGNLPTLKTSRLFGEVAIRPGALFSADDVDRTYRQLTALQQFRYINIVFDELPYDSLSAEKSLNCYITLNTDELQSYQVEVEGSNSSNHWGIGGNLNYNHRNVYRGAEMLSLKFRGAFEYQQDIIDQTRNVLYPNIFDYGVEANLRFPEFKLPFSSYRFLEGADAKTNLMAMYNHQKRPFYTRTLLNGSFGYLIRENERRTHAVNPFELNIISLTDTTPEFSQLFDTLFLRYSYESQFIAASSYTFRYNNQDKKKQRNFYFITARGEVAGNVLAFANDILGRQKTVDGFYEMFSTRFAQYVKAEVDLRYYQYLGKNSMLAYRGFVGVGYPYGNNVVLPFIKKYFIGGPNSIRAWRIRSLGPGGYVDDSFFPDLNADIKLEANVEYRFDIFRKIKGAVFVDMGNIWAINEFDERNDALFQWNRFYKQIAVGSGFGLRYDLDFILFRIDLGIKVADPELASDKRWLFVHRKIAAGDFNWNFGIDYPF